MIRLLKFSFLLGVLSCLPLRADLGANVYFAYQIGGAIPSPQTYPITSTVAITEYMQVTPDDGLIIDTLEAGCGFPADDICTHLKALCLKGCKTGNAKGPHSFGWFVAVTRQHFSELRAMEEARRNQTQ